ncbi:MAG: hypothetical protein Q4C72_00665 [Eubacteriales bacterium]|nr:hypothetical protein [Eubacteriales bacterium]
MEEITVENLMADGMVRGSLSGYLEPRALPPEAARTLQALARHGPSAPQTEEIPRAAARPRNHDSVAASLQ